MIFIGFDDDGDGFCGDGGDDDGGDVWGDGGGNDDDDGGGGGDDGGGSGDKLPDKVMMRLPSTLVIFSPVGKLSC